MLYSFFLFLDGIIDFTSKMGEIKDVEPKYWKTYSEIERSWIQTELSCSGLAMIENWHFSTFDLETKI